MDSDYSQQITLPFRRKTELIHALMRFIAAQPGAVPREDAFFKRFVMKSSDASSSNDQTVADPWLMEHVARLFWVCCELGLLKYQYPYPHKGQTYLPTRAGQIMARAPQKSYPGFYFGYLHCRDHCYPGEAFQACAQHHNRVDRGAAVVASSRTIPTHNCHFNRCWHCRHLDREFLLELD